MTWKNVIEIKKLFVRSINTEKWPYDIRLHLQQSIIMTSTFHKENIKQSPLYYMQLPALELLFKMLYTFVCKNFPPAD